MNPREKVLNVFEELNIPFTLTEHPPLFTIADYEKYDVKFDGMTFKNLFIRNQKKTAYYLVSLPENKRANLKLLQELLGETKLSFGSEPDLAAKLATTPGSVSALNIIGIENTDVQFIIDNEALSHEKVGFHPNDNTATITFAPSALETIMQKYNANYRFLTITEPSLSTA